MSCSWLRGAQTQTIRARIESVSGGQARGAEAVPELAGAAVGDGEAGVVVVVTVEPGSPAFEHGLRRGDVIAGVNRRPVRNVRELLSALSKAGRPILLNVVRGDYVFAIVLR